MSLFIYLQGFKLETRKYLSDFASVPSMYEHADILGDSDLWVLTNASQDVNCSEHRREAGWGHLGSHPSNGDARLPGRTEGPGGGAVWLPQV